MRKTYLAIILAVIYSISYCQTPENNPNWELVFLDEFDSTAMDKSKWKSSYNWNQKGYIPVEFCNNIPSGIIDNDIYGYRKRNFENCLLDTTNSGFLKIISKKENYWGTVWAWPLCTEDSCIGLSCDYTHDPPICFDIDSLPFNYTTNMLISKESFKYGYFEMRCKLSKPIPPMTNTGIGPNFWLFGGNDEVPWSEIDIFEFDGETDEFAYNIHYEDIYGDTVHGIESPVITVDFSVFHTFAINWTSEKIDFYFDDILYHSVDTACIPNLDTMPMIVDVNLPLHTMCQLVDTVYTQFPHYFEIDYVKVYQLKSDCENNYSICNYNNITYKHYNTITIGGEKCNVTVPKGETLFLTYSDKLNILSNFTLEKGAEILFERAPCFESVHVFPSKGDTIPQPAPNAFYKRSNPIYHE